MGIDAGDAFELQWRLIYSVIVAGKKAQFAEDAMMRLFGYHAYPLEQIRGWKDIEAKCREARTGNYGKLARCLAELASHCPDLGACGPQELELVHGIGPKTSRFFILWTRDNVNLAALDVHVLRWLGRMGYAVPRATPQSTKRYAEIERWFLAEAERRGATPRELDHAIWVEGAQHHERNEHTKELIRELPSIAKNA